MSDLKPIEGDFKVRMKMESDWHIGSGVGRRGDVDSLVRRDAEGMPFVPAKTLTGIWRDACETVAFALDDGVEGGTWRQLLDYIFGDQIRSGPDLEESISDKSELQAPRRALLSVRAAQSSKDLRDAIKARPYLKDAVTFVKPGIAIHPRTGRAKPDFLRFEEMARVGAELTAICQLTLPTDTDFETKCAATALLVAGASFVERIGGKRRRGAGRCRMEIAAFGEQDLAAWLDWITANPVPAVRLINSTAGSPEHRLEKRGSGDWVCLPIKITTLTPVIVPERTVGNLVQTLDYIPGTHLLPFITSNLDLSGVDIRSAIAHGDLVVTHFTPDVSGRPGRPTPLNLSYLKLEGGLNKGKGVHNRFEDAGQGPQLKPQRGGYVGATVKSGLPKYVRTKTSVETHNVVEDQSQRPTSDVGGVFSYQSIDRQSVLRGELRLRKSLADELDSSRQDWRTLLNSDKYCIGRARKDDYGSVRIMVDEVSATGERTKDRGTIPKEIRVWLLSDLLLRDERLRPSASITHFAAALGDQLGVTLMLRQTPKSGGQDKGPRKMDFAARPRRTDSWNTAWVLPRPSLVGLSAGSSFVFKVTDTKINAAEFSRRLKEVEANGLGERRAEGYGQMCFDDLLLSEELRGCTGSPDTANDRPEFTPVKDGSDEYRYAHLIEVEGWRKEIRRRALDKASTEEGREEAMGIKFDGHRSKPRMSQLGALRSVLMQLRDYQDADKVTAWIERVKESENRKKEWECSLKSIEKLVTDHQCVWKLLGESQDTWSDFTITSGGEKLLLNELWAEAVRTLVDACVRAQKRELEKLQKQNGNGSGKKGA